MEFCLKTYLILNFNFQDHFPNKGQHKSATSYRLENLCKCQVLKYPRQADPHTHPYICIYTYLYIDIYIYINTFTYYCKSIFLSMATLL